MQSCLQAGQTFMSCQLQLGLSFCRELAIWPFYVDLSSDFTMFCAEIVQLGQSLVNQRVSYRQGCSLRRVRYILGYIFLRVNLLLYNLSNIFFLIFVLFIAEFIIIIIIIIIINCKKDLTERHYLPDAYQYMLL